MKDKYLCPVCDTYYPIVINQDDQNIKTNRYFQMHKTHSIFVNFNSEFEVIEYKSYPIIRNVLETIVNNNVSASIIVNSLIRAKKLRYKPMLMFITDMERYKMYFHALVNEYVMLDEKLIIEHEESSLKIEHSNFKLIITSFVDKHTLSDKTKKSTSKLFGKQNIKLRSIIFDTSAFDPSFVKKISEEKYKLSSDVRVILAFNENKDKVPPIDLRDKIMDKYNFKLLEILNYKDTNGLNSIILDGYFNVVDDPLEAREAFEILQNKH